MGARNTSGGLAHPGWFQAFGAVMGMDWHSSGITTSVLGALKRGLAPVEWELGVHVCGGRGRESRKTPGELQSLGDRLGFDGASLADVSRLVAKVDGSAVQDGYALYLHGFIVADDGSWVVVQQGMNETTRTARRYHWLGEGLTGFVDAPHAAIDGVPSAEPDRRTSTDSRAAPAREAQIALVREGPDAVVRALRGRTSGWGVAPSATLSLPFHHDVRPEDVIGRRLHAAIAAAHSRGPIDFAELLLTPGVGARTVFALALAGEVVHGAPGEVSRSGALLPRARRKGRSSVSGAAAGVRRDDPGADAGGLACEARAERQAVGDPAAGYGGAPPGADGP